MEVMKPEIYKNHLKPLFLSIKEAHKYFCF